MNRYIEYLREKFFKSFDYNGTYVEVYENPTQKELKDIVKANKGQSRYEGVIRFGWYKNKLYAWDGNITHGDASLRLKIRDWDFGTWHDPRTNTIIGTDWAEDQSDLDDHKDVDKMITKIKKLIPTIKRLEFMNGDKIDI